MSHPVTGIDHVFLLVDDLDASRDAFARLGFTVSPRGLHSAAKGSANHTIMFPQDYVELLGLIAETPGNAPRREALARDGQGLHAVAGRIRDAALAETALNALGIATAEISDFARPVPLPGGGTGEAAFSTLTLDPAEVPLGTVFLCQHRTPETVWLPALMEHPNGARGMAGVLARTPDPEALAQRFARLFAAGSVEAVPGGFRVETGARSAPMVLLTDEALAARYDGLDLASLPRGAFAGLRIAVGDLGRTQAVLEQGGVAIQRTADGIAVGPRDAGGAVVEFVAV